MYCTNCGSKVLGENPNFCQDCGTPVRREGVAPAQEAQEGTPPGPPPAPDTVAPPAFQAPPATQPTYAQPPAQPAYAPPAASPPATAVAVAPTPPRKGKGWCCWVSGCGCLLLIAALVAGGIIAYPRFKGYIEPYIQLSGDPEALAARLSCQGFLMAQDQRNADAITAMLHPLLAARFNGSAFIDEDTSFRHEVLEQTRTAPTDFTIKVKDTPTSGDDRSPSVWIYTFRTDGGQWKLLWFDLESLPGDELPPEMQPESSQVQEEPPAEDESVNKVR